MSLYAGIDIKGGPSSSSSGSGSGATVGAAPGASPSQSPPAPKNNPSSSSTASTSSSNGQWSAALRFAPVPRKKAPTITAPSRPLYASISASTSPAAITSVGAGIGAPTSARKIQPYALSAAAAAAAAASENDPSSIRPRSQITRPPPITLDENDVNGFAQTAQGKKLAKKAVYASGAFGGSSSGGGGMGMGAKKQKELVLFGDDVVYDPLRPCDYSAYKAYVQGLRRQRRQQREEEERARRRARSYSGSSDYTSSEGEGEEQEDRAIKKARLFAPPTFYDSADPTQTSSFTATSTPAPAPAPEFAMKREETGEEAYLRRMAMSSGANKPLVAPPAPPRAAVPPPPPPPSTFIPSFAPPLPSFIPQTYPAPSATDSTTLPPSEAPRPYSANESIQGRVDPSSVQLSEAQTKAREIAEKLGRLAKMNSGMGESGIGGGGMETPGLSTGTGAVQPMGDYLPAEGAFDPSLPFAQRMMAKFGWEKGKGLGATESGMTSALSVSKNPLPTKKNVSNPAAPSNSSTSTIASHSNRIIDRSKEGRKTQLDHQWGEPSRIVLLTNLCIVSELDDDLTNEVAEEAAKFGVVERCLYRIIESPEGGQEEVRVFLVMSGLAGGYNGCRTFDGRFFGGKTVRARYYDEKAFERGEWGL
ncbi:hypothetical protein MVLG_06591 [Microbotryum lychnidis-dioicae p1A1 Lamole]|uniref:G-patch domain-containing protein n=1 Tax=Microbotryum lychnidis-dioicae (strain p1A1 Lamole / MvSl-1064) TaxID=683840 RepID=U5HHR5_USTV1|nr:hypothetical protein MVLG_06591 [Microbotryum lychnidis-dioicae p1A1 Lamole]|eukprot:KDE02872.1 hypothetical protein MVLG_06591 [Microbotryum lychnidis-dioicae p1A1 Lamole]